MKISPMVNKIFLPQDATSWDQRSGRRDRVDIIQHWGEASNPSLLAFSFSESDADADRLLLFSVDAWKSILIELFFPLNVSSFVYRQANKIFNAISSIKAALDRPLMRYNNTALIKTPNRVQYRVLN